MQLFVLHPNLEISSCDGGPNEQTIENKKLAYLSSLERYSDMIHKLSKNPSVSEIPNWCFTRETESNISELLKRNMTPALESLIIGNDDTNPSGYKKNCNELEAEKNGREHKGGMCQKKLEEIDRVEDLPIEVIKLTDNDKLPFKKSKGDKHPDGSLVTYMLQRIKLPTEKHNSSNCRAFLMVKYLGISTDILLVEYKYVQIYSRMNSIIKKYFSKPELTAEMEEEGFEKVNKQMDFFKKLENVLVRLRRLKAEFEDAYGATILDNSKSKGAGVTKKNGIASKTSTKVGE